MRAMAQGKFTVVCGPAVDETGAQGAISVEITSDGFMADPRGLGFMVGTVVGWFLDKVEETHPGVRSGPDQIWVMAEIQAGMARALEHGVIVPVVKD